MFLLLNQSYLNSLFLSHIVKYDLHTSNVGSINLRCGLLDLMHLIFSSWFQVSNVFAQYTKYYYIIKKILRQMTPNAIMEIRRSMLVSRIKGLEGAAWTMVVTFTFILLYELFDPELVELSWLVDEFWGYSGKKYKSFRLLIRKFPLFSKKGRNNGWILLLMTPKF